jgi:hypothetical protein
MDTSSYELTRILLPSLPTRSGERATHQDRTPALNRGDDVG